MALNGSHMPHIAMTVDHVDSNARFAESTGSPDAMQIRLAVGLKALVERQIEVDDHCHLLYVDTCVHIKQICRIVPTCNKHLNDTLTKGIHYF